MEVRENVICEKDDETKQNMTDSNRSLPDTPISNEPPMKRLKPEPVSSIYQQKDTTTSKNDESNTATIGLSAGISPLQNNTDTDLGGSSPNTQKPIERQPRPQEDENLEDKTSVTNVKRMDIACPKSMSVSSSSIPRTDAQNVSRQESGPHDMVTPYKTLDVVANVSNPLQTLCYKTNDSTEETVAPSSLSLNNGEDTCIAVQSGQDNPNIGIKQETKVQIVVEERTFIKAEVSDNCGDSSDVDACAIPSKSTTFHHLQHKYINELEYMLREFQKLERQLLGAKNQNTTESDGSRERREKLHSFIVHLEETIQQINTGCQVETELAKNNGTITKTENENVHNLEEHILSKLLPVKVRLKRQLEAQQGAKHNPAGMPTVRTGMQPLAACTLQPKATFLRSSLPSSVESRHHSTQFTKPLFVDGGEGSSLPQKLRGAVTDSIENPLEQSKITCDRFMDNQTIETKASVNASNDGVSIVQTPKIPTEGLSAVCSPVTAIAQPKHTSNPQCVQNHAEPYSEATTVAKISNKNDPTILDFTKTPISRGNGKANVDETMIERTNVHSIGLTCEQVEEPIDNESLAKEKAKNAPLKIKTQNSSDVCVVIPATKSTTAGYEERRRLTKKRRKKKKRAGDLSKLEGVVGTKPQAELVSNKRSKKISSQRGPRNVEYMCALCNEVYNSTCDFNPWWALTLHDCPKCEKVQVSIWTGLWGCFAMAHSCNSGNLTLFSLQIPRIDIGASANAIEYHPALLAHADENGGGNGLTPSAVVFSPSKTSPSSTVGSESESDLSDEDGLLSDGEDSLYSSESELDDVGSMSLAEQAENEKFGAEYEGPKLSDNHASRLLILILHASTCPGQ